MEWQSILQAVMSLLFVLGLLILTLWLVKYCELKGIRCRFLQKLSSSRRTEILEITRIDSKNSIAIIRCEDQEYTLVLNNGTPLLLKEKQRPTK